MSAKQVGLWRAIEEWTFGEDYSVVVVIDFLGSFANTTLARMAAFQHGLPGRYLINPSGLGLRSYNTADTNWFRLTTDQDTVPGHFRIEEGTSHEQGADAQGTGLRGGRFGGPPPLQS